MSEEDIIKLMPKNIICKIESIKHFSEGADSIVFLVNDKFLVKSNIRKNSIKAEVEFLTRNKNKLFQKIIYVDSKYRYVIYEYIPGKTFKNIPNPEELIQNIMLVTNSYSKVNMDGYGDIYDLKNTWRDFLVSELDYSRDNLVLRNINIKYPEKGLEILEKYPFEKKIIHGDFGTHNFIRDENGNLVGIIDPMAQIGDALYDILFAIVCRKEILTFYTMDKIYDLLPEEPKEKIDAMYKIQLYIRISRVVKYNLEDLEIYLNKCKEIGGEK